MSSTPVRHRRKSSIVAFLNSTKKAAKSLKSAARYDPDPTISSSGSAVGGVVESLKKKDAVSSAMCASCKSEDTNEDNLDTAGGEAIYTCLFISKVHKPDHSYGPGEAASAYSTYAFWKEGKERFVGVVRSLSGTTSDTSFVYCVVLPNEGGEVEVEIRQKLKLESLRKIVCPGGDMGASSVGGNLELKFDDSSTVEFSATPQMFAGENNNGYDTRESIVWNLMQLQKYLFKKTLPVDGIEVEELEFLSSVHGFLADNNALCELIDQMEEEGGGEGGEQEKLPENGNGGGSSASTRKPSPSPKKKVMNLFSDRQEEMDAEAVLNSLPWATTNLEGLKVMLQDKLEALEVDCCKQLIEWENEGGGEDEKGGDERKKSLGSLVSTLTKLDEELAQMEKWLEERNLAIKPLTVDCREIENENNALEQTWRSYGSLAKEMDRLLNGLSIDAELENVLKDPLGCLGISSAKDRIQIDQIDSEAIDVTHKAGCALRAALDRAAEGGGVHLAAVNQRVETLLVISSNFCQSLGDALLNMFAELGEDMANGLYVIEGGGAGGGRGTYDSDKDGIALKIKNTQRKFQTLIMEFQPLIETLGSLKPEKVVNLRRGYADAVSKGVFNRKMVGDYFQLLRGVGEGEGLEPVGGEGWGGGWLGEGGGMGLKDYEVAELRGGGGVQVTGGGGEGGGIGSEDADSKISMLGSELEQALADFVPMISREGYFISSLFGLDAKQGDNDAVKKRKVESVCGCIHVGTGVVEEGLNLLAGVGGNEVLSNLVGSLKFGESMKKLGEEGGQTFSRDVLRKMKERTDKVWEGWVEDQVAWVEEGHGIPYNGKRAGVFGSFSRFPTLLDRIISNIGKDVAGSEGIVGGIVKIGRALFSSLKSVVERESTDKQYASNVVVLENCNFFITSIRKREGGIGDCLNSLLEEAKVMFGKACDRYVKWAIKREFKGLYALFSNISRIRKDVGDDDVLIHCPRTTFARTIEKEAGGVEVKEKVGEIRKRMEKHMTEGSGGLDLVWEELGMALMKDYASFNRTSGNIFNVKMDIGVSELGKILNAAGGDVRAVMRRRSGVERRSTSSR